MQYFLEKAVKNHHSVEGSAPKPLLTFGGWGVGNPYWLSAAGEWGSDSDPVLLFSCTAARY